MSIPSTFKVLSAPQVEAWLARHPAMVFDLVRQSYLAHAQGRTVNPDSYFLHFPDSDKNRIIALPASLEDEDPVAGLKWISSFPENVHRGGDRASALMLLNDRKTGYPLACLEGSAISAARTAGSAAVGAEYLHPVPRHARTLGIVGCGPIGFGTVSLLTRLGWTIDRVLLSDLSADRTRHFQAKITPLGLAARPAALEEVIRSSDLVLFTTSAVSPFVTETGWFEHAPTVLHMSLRDLSADIIAASQNVADDVEHCLKARTSLDLAVQQYGHRRFIDGGIAEAIAGGIRPDPARTRIYSPFGMGILDLAVAREIVRSVDDGGATLIADFFPKPYFVPDPVDG